jgi:hypothetical protein
MRKKRFSSKPGKIIRSTHSSGPRPSMRVSTPRRFTLFDAMVLIAATAIPLLPLRLFMSGYSGLSSGSYLGQAVELGLIADALLCPLAMSLSLALWALRLRQPRPDVPRVYRQPGMAACTATLVFLAFFLTATLISLFLSYFAGVAHSKHMFTQFNFVIWLLIVPLCLVGISVLAVWTVLWSIGAWRPEPSWIDRAGRVLGVYWVANSVIYGSLFLAGFH